MLLALPRSSSFAKLGEIDDYAIQHAARAELL